MQEQWEKVSRVDEIRALFIFGLLAVLASFRVQNAQLPVKLAYGTLQLIPIIDEIIVMWSLFAIFMIIGLSKDVVGKVAARTFRAVSITFLQLSFAFLGIILLPAAILAYGTRFILILALIFLTFVVGLIFYLHSKGFGWQSVKSAFNRRTINRRVTLNNAKYRFITGAAFVISSYVMLTYADSGYASSGVIVVCYAIAAVSVSVILCLSSKNDDWYYEGY